MIVGRFRLSRGALVLAGLLIAAAWLRFDGLDWDHGHHLHPDERFLTMVGTAVRLPSSPAEYFDTARSPLNPSNAGHRFFVYGTLPLFLVRAVAEAIGLAGYAHLHLVGRALAALFDLGTILLVFRIGLLLAGRRVALGAAALLTFSVLSIQQAHFFTVDSFAAFFATAGLLALARLALGAGIGWHVTFGAALGLTIACRPNLAAMGALYPVALAYAWRVRRVALPRIAAGAALAAAVAAVTVRVCLPYAFAGPGFFTASLAPDFVHSLRDIRAYATGEVHYPPGVQWIGRVPVLFPARNLFVWALGPAWGLAALAGVAWGLFRRGAPGEDEEAGAGRVVLLWAPLLFFLHAPQFAATGRYFLPLVPVLAVAAAWLLASPRARSRTRTMLFASIVALTAAWALAFTSIYRHPHTRVEASRWIYEHVEPGAVVATEHWDDALPLPMETRNHTEYETVQLTLYDEETEDKRRQLIAALDRADVIVLSSNRLYGSIPRAPWRYPLARRYYELLFAGELGFRVERVFTSYPRLGPIEIVDDGAEEAFTVYDHPKVIVFRKAEPYSPERTAALLDAVSLAGVVQPSPRESSALYRRTRPGDIRLRAGDEVRSPAGGRDVGSVEAAIRWLVALEALALAVFALLFRRFAMLGDGGYGLAKLLAWLGPGTIVWLLASTGLAAQRPATARTVALVLIAAGGWTAWRRRSELGAFLSGAAHRRAVVAAEAVFLSVFALFLAIRILNPAIYWGEKPMDFAILNATFRAAALPPADPWFAGAPLNYFYFGHALTAIFGALTAVPPALAFNLAIPTVAALLATAAFLFVRRVTGRIAAGVAGAAAVTLLGNLAGPRLFAAGEVPPLDFHYFWATSRVVPGTINEFPFWNLVFADLHAHVLAMPLEAALLYLGSLWIAVRPDDRRPSSLVLIPLVAWVLGALAVTSAWSIPLAAAIQLAFLATAWYQGTRGAAGLARAVAIWIVIVVLARLLFAPFWAHYTTPNRHWGFLGAAEMAPLTDVLTVFGALLVAAVPVIGAAMRHGMRDWRSALPFAGAVVAALAIGALRSPSCGLFAFLALAGAVIWATTVREEVRIGALLIAAAGGAGVVTETAFLWDRMNTVFKFYLQMWLLLGTSAAVFAWVALGRASGRTRAAMAAALAATAATATFTSVTGLIGYLRTPHAATGAATLDGLAYLRQTGPSELQAFRWLNREIRGIPVLLEAQGPSYQAFSRVSMNTGLPTVLGWEYHLVQQSRPPDEIAARAAEVRELYETTSLTRAERLLRKYHIDLVFVGPLERQTYAAAGLGKFDGWPLLEPVFRNRDVTIYATPGRRSSVKTWIEPVPRAAAAGVLREPRALATAPDGTIYVADFGNRRVQRFSADLGVVDAFGSEGSGPGDFRDPCGIAVSNDGTVWVADTWNHRIQKLAPDGRQLAEWRAGMYGPRGITVSDAGDVYVTDTGNHRILRFAPDGEATVVVPPGSLDHPVGIALGRDGDIYVADSGHQRVVVVAKDGTLRRQWRVDGWSDAARREPYLAVGPDGVVWVTDPSGGRVLLFDATGAALGEAASASPLRQPLGIALIDANRAVIADAGSGRIVEVRRP